MELKVCQENTIKKLLVGVGQRYFSIHLAGGKYEVAVAGSTPSAKCTAQSNQYERPKLPSRRRRSYRCDAWNVVAAFAFRFAPVLGLSMFGREAPAAILHSEPGPSRSHNPLHGEGPGVD